MPKRATGQLILKPSGYYARVTTTIDGERVRVTKALGTRNKLAARRKLERLLAEPDARRADLEAGETFGQAAERVYQARIAEVDRLAGERLNKGPREWLSQLRRYAFPALEHIPVTRVQPSDINAALDAVRDAGKSRATAYHLRQRMSNVFAELRREGAIAQNPVTGAAMPRFASSVTRERAVLTDAELAVYLAWEHATLHLQGSVRERQTMACVSRMFGGLRTGDLHALRWEGFETEGGAFTWGYAPRQKTRRPQLLEVPAMLRPFLRDHWERAGRPREGLVFPARRVGKRGDRIGQERRHVSHAQAFRRDLQEAFNAARARDKHSPAPAPGSARWRELFEECPYTRPVDFHSWRRAYVQALADADVNAQQAAALAGHASLAAHAVYLRNAGKLRKLPEGALPSIAIGERASENEKAQRLGTAIETAAESCGHAETTVQENTNEVARSLHSRRAYKANVAGSTPVPPTLIRGA